MVFLRLAILIALIAYVALAAMVYFYQDRLLFPAPPEGFDQCVAARDLGLRRVSVEVDDENVRARVYLHPEAQGTLIYFHGNADSSCSSLEHFAELSKDKLNLVFAAYPGYEGDVTPASQVALLGYADRLLKWLNTQPDLNRRPPFVFGESLGSGVAVYVASRNECSGLILKSPYSSVLDVAKAQYWFLPVSRMLKHPFPSTDWAPAVRCPSIILHGDRDPTVPIRFGQKLSAVLPPPTEFVTIPGAAHNNLTTIGKAEFWPPIHAFIEKHLLDKPPR